MQGRNAKPRSGNGRASVPTLREWVIEIVVMFAIGVVLAALGPFGTFALGSFADRLLYWIPAALIGYTIVRPTTLVALLIAKRLALPEVPSAGAGVLLAAIPGTFAIAYLGGYRPASSTQFEKLFQLYLNVALISILVMLIFLLIEYRTSSSAPPRQGATPVSSTQAPMQSHEAAPFLQRLPAAWRDHLVALEMEDHYVRAHGSGTSALILLRMRDAERELAGHDGLRVHRSWWVARSAVRQVVRNGRNVKLRLEGGLEAPVARDRIVELEKAGWMTT